MTMLGYGLASAVLVSLVTTVSGGGITSKLQVHVSVSLAETTRSTIVVVPILRRTPIPLVGWVLRVIAFME